MKCNSLLAVFCFIENVSVFFQVTDEVYAYIESIMTENDETSLTELQQGLAEKDIYLSTSTIDTVRRKLGFTFKGIYILFYMQNYIDMAIIGKKVCGMEYVGE